MAKAAHERIDAFFILHAGRADSWRNVENIASRWHAGKSRPEEPKAALADLATLEEFHAIPGPRIMRLLHECIENDDAKATHGLIRRISEAVLMNRDLSETTEESGAGGQDVTELLPSAFGFGDHKRPSFETLFVTAQPQERWSALCD